MPLYLRAKRSEKMECNIFRVKTTFNHCHFKSTNAPCWEVVGVRTHGMKRCKFSVYKDDELQYCLAQTSLIKQIIACLPVISFIYRNPFYCFRNDKCCGYWRNKTKFLGQGIFEFNFDENKWTITIHSKGIHSLLKNEKQVAVYKRFGAGNYHVLYSKEVIAQPDILILFAAFVENFLTLDTNTAEAPETYFIPFDKFIDRARWLPEDNFDEIPFL